MFDRFGIHIHAARFSSKSAILQTRVSPWFPSLDVILRSRTEQVEFLSSLQTALAATALLVAVLMSYGVARTVTRPVGAIIATIREMSDTGDLTKKITLPDPGRWNDEDTQLLAKTFNTMTASIARFQQEAAQRERLSFLGRLSTIVAHEIRNPLMIIKMVLRTLRRQTGLPDPAQTAAQDIDEEIDRLNLVVGEVLDFARPIRIRVFAGRPQRPMHRRCHGRHCGGRVGLASRLRLGSRT